MGFGLLVGRNKYFEVTLCLLNLWNFSQFSSLLYTLPMISWLIVGKNKEQVNQLWTLMLVDFKSTFHLLFYLNKYKYCKWYFISQACWFQICLSWLIQYNQLEILDFWTGLWADWFVELLVICHRLLHIF